MGDGNSEALPALALRCNQHSVALAGTGAVISKFNRDTMVLTVGLLGTVIFAALVLAVQDPHPKTAVVTDEASQPGGDLSLNAKAWQNAYFSQRMESIRQQALSF